MLCSVENIGYIFSGSMASRANSTVVQNSTAAVAATSVMVGSPDLVEKVVNAASRGYFLPRLCYCA